MKRERQLSSSFSVESNDMMRSEKTWKDGCDTQGCEGAPS